MTSIAFNFRREIMVNNTAAKIMGCSVFVILTAIGAYIRIPLFFTPVPVTLQTFFVLLSGAFLGRKWGALSQAAYVSLGIAGLPVFQGYGYGMGHLLGPTGGYLLGFIAASYITGLFSKNIFAAMLAGLAAIYISGVIWLKVFLGAGLPESLMMGLYPFIPGEIVKVIAASYIYRGLKTGV